MLTSSWQNWEEVGGREEWDREMKKEIIPRPGAKLSSLQKEDREGNADF